MERNLEVNEINLDLRASVLEKALVIEDLISQFISGLLAITNPKTKAISHKSGSLSFKNKLDLLFDLDVLSADEHQTLLLLMEFRNQFMHNLHCCSFVDAVDLLGQDKGNRLLKLFVDPFLEDGCIIKNEANYKSGFRHLYLNCLDVLRAKLHDRTKSQAEKFETIKVLSAENEFLIDQYFDFLDSIATRCEEEEEAGNQRAEALLTDIAEILRTAIRVFDASEKYQEIKNRQSIALTSERLNALFRR